MLSSSLMKLWIAAYILTAIVALHERNFNRVLYYVSASGLTLAVLWGIK